MVMLVLALLALFAPAAAYNNGMAKKPVRANCVTHAWLSPALPP
jgi:hypothetical protein